MSNTPEHPRKHKTRKIILIILGFFLLLAIAFQVFIDRYLEPIIHQRLEKLIVSGSDSLYTFQLDKINVNFWGSSVVIKNLHINVDSAHYAQREKAGTLPALTSEIRLAKGSIGGINLLQLVLKKKISIGNITSKNADISFSRHFKKSNKEMNPGNEPLWKTLQPDIQSISIDKILLNDIKLSYTNADSAKAFKWNFEHCSAIIDNTKVDSAAAADTSRILFSKDISIQFNEIKLKTADALYAIETKQVWYSSSRKSVKIEEFKFQPVLSQKDFYKKVGYDKDRFSLHFPKIELVSFQLPQWINQNVLVIDTVNLVSPQINIYKDRTATPDMRSKIGKYPHQLLSKAPFTILVKQINVADGRATYTEKSQKSELEGKLIFQKLHGAITNVTNDDERIKKNSNCVVDINGIFMQKSKIHAVFTFHMNEAATGGFETSADITNLDAEQLNPITIPLAQASIKSFNLKELHYYISGNDRIGTGNLRMIYSDLQLELQKINEDDGTMKKKGLLSFLVNKLVVYNDNNAGDKERKAVNIRTERIVNKSFFNLVWKTLFNSAKEIAIRIDNLKTDKSQKKKKK